MFKQLKPQKQTYCFISDSFENIPDYFGDRQICNQVGFIEHTWTRKVGFFNQQIHLNHPIITPKCNEVPQLLSSIRPQWCWFRSMEASPSVLSWLNIFRTDWNGHLANISTKPFLWWKIESFSPRWYLRRCPVDPWWNKHLSKHQKKCVVVELFPI